MGAVRHAGYRYAGFGTHEFLVYYDLVRELLWEYWGRVVARWETGPDGQDREAGRWMTIDPGTAADVRDGKSGFDRKAEIAFLREHRDHWLRTPNFEDLSGELPQDVIETERRRIPATGDPHMHMPDEDCPLCQMMAEMPGPMFWHLDGCNNDDDFPFSWHLETYEEWVQEQRDHEEFSRRFEEQQRERERRREAGLLPPEADPFGSEGIWQRSFSDTTDPLAPASIQLFGIGSHLAELIENLREKADSAPLIEPLNRYFANLGEVLETGATELLGPAVSRLCDELGGVANMRQDLCAKCEDLARQLRRLEQSPPNAPAEADDFPF